jgi:hypothetical protein
MSTDLLAPSPASRTVPVTTAVPPLVQDFAVPATPALEQLHRYAQTLGMPLLCVD